MRRTGALYIAGSESGYRAAKGEWAERERQGVVVRGADARADARQWFRRSPGRSPRRSSRRRTGRCRARSPSSRRSARASGRRSRSSTQEVTALHPEEREVAVMTDEGGDLPFDRVVVAGGVWSRDAGARPWPQGLARDRARLQHHLRDAALRPADADLLRTITASSPRRSPTGCGSAARSRWRRPRPRPTTRGPRRCGR